MVLQSQLINEEINFITQASKKRRLTQTKAEHENKYKEEEC